MLTNRVLPTPRRIAFYRPLTPFATEAMAPILVLLSSPLFGSESMFLPAASKFCQKSCSLIFICSRFFRSVANHVTRSRDVSSDETFVSCFRFFSQRHSSECWECCRCSKRRSISSQHLVKNEQSFLSPAEVTTETEPGGRGQLRPSRRPLGLPVAFSGNCRRHHIWGVAEANEVVTQMPGKMSNKDRGRRRRRYGHFLYMGWCLGLFSLLHWIHSFKTVTLPNATSIYHMEGETRYKTYCCLL